MAYQSSGSRAILNDNFSILTASIQQESEFAWALLSEM
jgi:hypothetical protein